ncbi:IclR family transcriptional regulator C-terminal domain-containing protein, partial [Streptomyces sp. SID5910]|uniref:IclR family transcriptional regulator domain-containing protein n=1 Tax=Streptomyces sp. SID5910 TaxID=2690312 RepID=UPI0013AA1B9E
LALITHEHAGLVAQSPNRTYTLTPRVLSLGFPPLSRLTLPEIAQPHLTALASRVNESASLSVLSDSGTAIQYTAQASPSRVMSARIPLGTRVPAPATSSGRVLLTNLAEGYALVDEELEAGLRSIAVPIHDRTGRPVAALNVAMHAARRTPEACVTDILPALRETATHIETDLHTAARFTPVPPT